METVGIARKTNRLILCGIFSHACIPWRVQYLAPVPPICVSESVRIGLNYGLSPIQHQAIIWTNARLLSIGPLGTNFGELLIGIQNFSFSKMHLKISSAKWRPFCQGVGGGGGLTQEKNGAWRAILIISANRRRTDVHVMNTSLNEPDDRIITVYTPTGEIPLNWSNGQEWGHAWLVPDTSLIATNWQRMGVSE